MSGDGPEEGGELALLLFVSSTRSSLAPGTIFRLVGTEVVKGGALNLWKALRALDWAKGRNRFRGRPRDISDFKCERSSLCFLGYYILANASSSESLAVQHPLNLYGLFVKLK